MIYLVITVSIDYLLYAMSDGSSPQRFARIRYTKL